MAFNVVLQQSGKTNFRKLQPVDHARGSIPVFQQVGDLTPPQQLLNTLDIISEFQVVLQRTIVYRERRVYETAPVEGVVHSQTTSIETEPSWQVLSQPCRQLVRVHI